MGKEHKKYHILIDQKPHTWEEQFITGMQIKTLAGVDQSYGVWIEVSGPEDPPVEDDQKVDLGEPGIEKFFTGKKQTTEG